MGGPSCRLRFSVAAFLAAMLSCLAPAFCQSRQAEGQPQARRGVQDVTATPAPRTEPAKYYALVIGNNHYRNVAGLQTPVNDAKSVAQLLQDRYGFKINLLIDATRDDIFTALVLYRKSLTPNSNLLIYYAGHGYLDRDADESYWLPVDADKDNNENWISADDITRSVRAMPSKHVLVVSDSCYSGAILQGRDLRDSGSGINPQERVLYLAKKQSAKSRNWMASGSVEPVADDGAPGHSIFAAAILQGLGQAAEDQFAASDLFYSFVQRKVGGNALQLPQYGSIRNSGDDLGDFIFSRAGAPLADLPDKPPALELTPQPTPDLPVNYGSSFDSETDRNAITAVLHQFEEARKRKDASALWKIWPGAPLETKQRIEAYFKSAASIRTSLQMDPPEISQDLTTATVSGQMRETYTPKNGEAPPARNEDITFTLKKNNGTWTIADVK